MARFPPTGWDPARAPFALLLLPFATFALAAAYATAESSALAAAESRYLALVIALATAVLAALRPDRPAVAVAGSGLALIAFATVGSGIARGAVTVTALAALVAIAGVGRWRRTGGPGDLVSFLGLALAIQLFARPRLLLAPYDDHRRLAALLVLPLVAAICASLVARRWGAARVLIAGGACATVGPGFTLTTTLVWVALAGAALWHDAAGSHPRAPAVGSMGTVSRRIAAVALTLVPLTVLAMRDATLAGAAIVLAALLSADDRRTPRLAVAGTALAVAILAPAFGLGRALSAQVLVASGVATLALVPSALRLGGRDLDRVPAYLALVFLAAASGERQALAPVVTALALGLGGHALPRLQAWWTATTLTLTVLLAAYPWVRMHPSDDAHALLRLDGWRSAVLAALAVVALGAVIERLTGEAGRRRWANAVGAVGAVIALAVASGATPTAAFAPSTTLDAARGGWEGPLDGATTVQRVTVDSSLTNSLALPPNALLAFVTLRGEDGAPLAEWQLRVDHHSAEWAAERADVAQRLGDRRPQPHAAAVAADGTFFARRYRARFELARPAAGATHVAVRRIRRLPEAVQLVLHRIEVTP